MSDGECIKCGSQISDCARCKKVIFGRGHIVPRRHNEFAVFRRDGVEVKYLCENCNKAFERWLEEPVIFEAKHA